MPVVADPAPASPHSGEPDLEKSASTSILAQFGSIVKRPGVVDALLSGIGFGLFFAERPAADFRSNAMAADADGVVSDAGKTIRNGTKNSRF